jgi:hypothetical protein
VPAREPAVYDESREGTRRGFFHRRAGGGLFRRHHHAGV